MAAYNCVTSSQEMRHTLTCTHTAGNGADMHSQSPIYCIFLLFEEPKETEKCSPFNLSASLSRCKTSQSASDVFHLSGRHGSQRPWEPRQDFSDWACRATHQLRCLATVLVSLPVLAVMEGRAGIPGTDSALHLQRLPHASCSCTGTRTDTLQMAPLRMTGHLSCLLGRKEATCGPQSLS